MIERQYRVVQPISVAAKKSYLKTCALRAQHLVIGRGPELAAQFTQALENFDSAAEGNAEFLQRVSDKDPDAVREFQNIAVTVVDNFLYATANYANFFEAGALGDSDSPFIENIDHHEVAISIVGQDGGAPRWQRVRAHDRALVPFYKLTTGDLEYALTDAYAGQIADRAKANLDMAGDLNLQLDGKLFTFVQSAIGAFTLSGTSYERVYLPHSRINPANLPTTNLLIPSDNSTTTLFRTSCLKSIIAYCKAWGEQTFADGPLYPVAVFIPSAHVTGFLNDCLVNDPANELNRQIFDSGFIMNYGGYRWMFIGDPTLDPAQKLAYVRMNKGIGIHWTKPSLDKILVDNSYDRQKENRELTCLTKTFFTTLIGARRMNVCAVQYRT